MRVQITVGPERASGPATVTRLAIRSDKIGLAENSFAYEIPLRSIKICCNRYGPMNTLFSRRRLLQCLPGLGLTATAAPQRIPDRTVVLTFDDAVKSHRTFVAPLLKELGFNATFFVTHRWMDDKTNFMTWAEIAEIHRMGFEIGNHAWTHANYSTPREGSRLAGNSR